MSRAFMSIPAVMVIGLLASVSPAQKKDRPTEFREPFTEKEKQQPYVQAKSHDLYDWPFVDGQWEGIVVDNRGRVWFSVSSHGPQHHAQLFMYEPDKDRVRHVADLGQAVGEKLADTPTQDKIHTDMFVDGKWIYAATCDGGGSDSPYEGGYWLKIDTETGEIHADKTSTGDGMIAMGYDRQRDLLYGHSNHEGWLVKYDLETGKERNLGYAWQDREAEWPRGIDLMIAPDGKVFGLRPPRCTIWQYDPETDAFSTVDVDMPTPRDVEGKAPRRSSGHTMPEKKIKEHWENSAGHMSFWDEKLDCFWFLRHHDQMLMKFFPPTDGQKARVEAVENLGRGYGMYHSFPASCTLAMDENRVIWYTPGSGWGGQAYLQSYNTETGEFRDYGPIITDDGRRVTENHALVAHRGKLYMVGFVFNLEGSDDPVRKWAGRGKWPFHARFLIVDPAEHTMPGTAGEPAEETARAE